MEYCDCHADCFFYKDNRMSIPRTREALKDTYCKADYTRCAIYKRSRILGIKHVPTHLHPDDLVRITR